MFVCFASLPSRRFAVVHFVLYNLFTFSLSLFSFLFVDINIRGFLSNGYQVYTSTSMSFSVSRYANGCDYFDVTGTFIAPISGAYTFYLSSDLAQLNLTTGSVHQTVASAQYEQSFFQTSQAGSGKLLLVKGQSVVVAAGGPCNTGNINVYVSMSMPDGSFSNPLSSRFYSGDIKRIVSADLATLVTARYVRVQIPGSQVTFPFRRIVALGTSDELTPMNMNLSSPFATQVMTKARDTSANAAFTVEALSQYAAATASSPDCNAESELAWFLALYQGAGSVEELFVSSCAYTTALPELLPHCTCLTPVLQAGDVAAIQAVMKAHSGEETSELQKAIEDAMVTTQGHTAADAALIARVVMGEQTDPQCGATCPTRKLKRSMAQYSTGLMGMQNLTAAFATATSLPALQQLVQRANFSLSGGEFAQMMVCGELDPTAPFLSIADYIFNGRTLYYYPVNDDTTAIMRRVYTLHANLASLPNLLTIFVPNNIQVYIPQMFYPPYIQGVYTEEEFLEIGMQDRTIGVQFYTIDRDTKTANYSIRMDDRWVF